MVGKSPPADSTRTGLPGPTENQGRAGPLRPGDRAPSFRARLSTGEEISLEQFAGRKNVVLFFYPKDDSYGCTKQVCSLRDHYPEIGSHDAVLFGVSPDGDASHRRFIAAHRLPFGLIADPDGTLSRLYRTTRYGGRPAFVRRVTFVIDKRGVIHTVAHHEFRIAKHHQKILSALRDLALRDGG